MIAEMKIGHCYSFSRQDGCNVILGSTANYSVIEYAENKINFILLEINSDDWAFIYKIIYNNRILYLKFPKNLYNTIIKKL